MKKDYKKALPPALRSAARNLGLGKTLLRIHKLGTITPKGAIELWLAKKRYLKGILKSKPISAGEGPVEAHMLLNHARIYEGLWSLYSFAYFCNQPCRIILHDDGTLTPADLSIFSRVFPHTRVVDRHTADSRVLKYFSDKRLKACEKLRQTLAFGLKLFDPFFFSENNYFILLDSDVLFFSYPAELFSNTTNLYFRDNGNRYCLDSEEMKALSGDSCIERVNPGVLKVARDIPNLQEIERYLQHPKFWNPDGSAHYFAEMTLWAMELTKRGAFPLPETYAICPGADEPGLISGHYCGDEYWRGMFYKRGLRRLAPILTV